jgi:hypothetical protein
LLQAEVSRPLRVLHLMRLTLSIRTVPFKLGLSFKDSTVIPEMKVPNLIVIGSRKKSAHIRNNTSICTAEDAV